MSLLTFLARRWQRSEDVTVRGARGVRQSAAGAASLLRSPAPPGGAKGGEERELSQLP